MKAISSNKRMCVVSRKKIDKNKLLKITNIKGEWQKNEEPYKGRSFYLKDDKETIEKFLSKKKHNIRKFVLTDSLKEELINHAQNL